MLLDFSVENYKSFLENAQFSMIPAPKQHGLDYSILKEKVGRKNVKGLCSAVIYGPNASGKTNIIGAMDVLRSIVLRGNIRNAEEQNSPNKAAYNLELIPNNLIDEIKPVIFRISFAPFKVMVIKCSTLSRAYCFTKGTMSAGFSIFF